ncbi:MAG: transcriptional regulator [Chloroflexi bacterium]|nr:transcriptional regulator [Chloroflexota bacterium]
MTTGTLNYQELLQTFVPRPITTETEYDEAVTQLNMLIDKIVLTPDEQDFLTLLGTLISAYEDEHYPDEEFKLRGIELVKGLMELHELKQKDLVPIFKTKSIVSAVLNGKRPLTVEHIDKLAKQFDLPHELFFEPDSYP